MEVTISYDELKELIQKAALLDAIMRLLSNKDYVAASTIMTMVDCAPKEESSNEKVPF